MPFDLDRLFSFCRTETRQFAVEHAEEDFYAFAISGSWLCLNSEQEFAKTLKDCQEDWDHKHRPISKWEDLTEDEIRDADFLLRLPKDGKGLDLSDKAASLSAINALRARQRDKGSPYRTPAGIQKLRDNTGDWEYEGFADMVESGGFDEDAPSAEPGAEDVTMNVKSRLPDDER